MTSTVTGPAAEDADLFPPGYEDALAFPLVEALLGRRSRRFSRGASVPEGPLTYTSRHQPLPLSELEQQMVLTAAAGNTGWHYAITRHARYAPHLSTYMEGHNTWCVNRTGSTLLIPVADVARHHLAILCFLVQNGNCLYDDVHGGPIPGLERFQGLVDVDNPFPLTLMDQYALAEATAELATSCYAGALMLQAMGLGGWMFDGVDRLTVLGAGGDPAVPGLGFRYDSNERWALPNPTGLPGVFEGYCPPHYPDMRAAVEAFVQRKFGPGGPFHADTPGRGARAVGYALARSPTVRRSWPASH